MAIPNSKQKLVEAITTTYGKLAQELARVPPALARDPVLEGQVAGTRMSVCDLLAYLVGWNELVLHWHAQLRDGKRIEDIAFPAEGFTWNALGKLAQRFYADYAELSMEDLQQRLEQAKDQLLALIESHDDAQLYGQAWYTHYTMGRMIQFNTSSPYANARTRLRAWLKTL
ncbi:ClbS/DfsB family four-helix bundle protein [Janthinobacterium lividum]|nr:ClbS/DfsB family four-helix bundle protein [Janthinobacterium lividum]